MFGLMLRACVPKEISGEKSWYFNLFIMGVGSGLRTEIENNNPKTTEIEGVDSVFIPIVDVTSYHTEWLTVMQRYYLTVVEGRSPEVGAGRAAVLLAALGCIPALAFPSSWRLHSLLLPSSSEL